MPEIVKMEQRIIDFQETIDKSNIIIRRFDENILNKVDKTMLQEFEMRLQ